jgi:hypothetical protein
VPGVRVGVGLALIAVAGVFGALSPAVSAWADDCADGYLVRCTENGSSRHITNPGVSRPVGQLPTVQGVPCTGQHLGVCIALTQAQGGSFPGLTTGPVLGPGAIIRNSP